MSSRLSKLQKKWRAVACGERARVCERFFKTGPGEYAEGDRFLGLTVPFLRSLLPSLDGLEDAEVLELLYSPWHEERFLAIALLVRRFQKAKRQPEVQKAWVHFYLKHRQQVNNWDLVDASAPQMLGPWFLLHDREQMQALAQSGKLWEERMAVVATWAFIRAGEFAETQRLSTFFLRHPHDLMHKACGWMLREMGKRSEEALLHYLDRSAHLMPRTMLRYAIEKLPTNLRKQYLSQRVPS